MNDWFIYLIIVIVIMVFAILTFRWRKTRRVSLKYATYRGILTEAVNCLRQTHALPPLGRVGFLDALARQHSKQMAKRDNCDHVGFDRRADRVQKEIGRLAVGENCYMCPAEVWDDAVVERVVNGWLKSDEHRDNMLKSEYRRTGIGVRFNRGHVYVTQIYAG
jgi:uncharacterized protein YkwD